MGGSEPDKGIEGRTFQEDGTTWAKAWRGGRMHSEKLGRAEKGG